MTTQAPDSEALVVEAKHRLWVLWLFVSVAVVVTTTLTLWVVLGDEGTPSVTFDGQSVTYEGPKTFDAGVVTFKFDASALESSAGGEFVIGEITDSISFEDMKAWAAQNSAGAVPPFASFDFEAALVNPGHRIVEKSFDLEQGARYSIWAINYARQHTNTNWAYPVVIIEVR